MTKKWALLLGILSMVLVAGQTMAEKGTFNSQVTKPVDEAIKIRQNTQKKEEGWSAERRKLMALHEQLQQEQESLQVQKAALVQETAMAGERAAPERLAGPTPRTTEELPKDVLGTGTAKAELLEDAAKIEVAEDIFLGIALLKPGRAELIILIPLFRITEDSVCFADLLELFFRRFISLGMVWMVFHCQFPVCFF